MNAFGVLFGMCEDAVTTAGSIFSTDLNVELNVGATLEIQIQV